MADQPVPAQRDSQISEFHLVLASPWPVCPPAPSPPFASQCDRSRAPHVSGQDTPPRPRSNGVRLPRRPGLHCISAFPESPEAAATRENPAMQPGPRADLHPRDDAPQWHQPPVGPAAAAPRLRLGRTDPRGPSRPAGRPLAPVRRRRERKLDRVLGRSARRAGPAPARDSVPGSSTTSSPRRPPPAAAS